MRSIYRALALALVSYGLALGQSVSGGGGSGSSLCTLSNTQTAGYVLTATDTGTGCDWETVGGASVDANTIKNAWFLTDGGSANAVTGTTTTAFPGAYATGQAIIFKAAATNSGATTININSLGNKNITKAGATALAAGNKVTGVTYMAVYDGTEFQLVGYTLLAADLPSTVVTAAAALTSTAIMTGGGSRASQTPSATATLDSSGNISTPGTLTTGVGGGVAGSDDMGAGTPATVAANAFGWGAGATMTTSVRLISPNAVPAANQAMLFGAPNGSNIATWAWTGISGTGSFAMTASPTFTGTITGAAETLSGAFTNNGSYAGSAVLPVANGGTNCSSATITCFNNITGFTAAGTTGTTSTSLVFSTSPTLVTPTLGAATVTTVNKVTITAPASAATLTIPDGVTMTGPAASGTVATLGNTNTLTGRQDATGAASTAPAKTGTSLPGTCIVGDLYFKSDATAGQNIYECQSTNTWTQQLNSGGSGGGSAGSPLFTYVNATGTGPNNTGTETSLIGTATTGSKTISANVMVAGTMLQSVTTGSITTPAVPDNLTINMYMGATKVATGTITGTNIASLTGQSFALKVNAFVLTGGATCALVIQDMTLITATVVTGDLVKFQGTGTTFDCTATQAFDVKAQWATIGQSGESIVGQGVGLTIPGTLVSSVNSKVGAVALTLNSSDFANEGTATTVLHGAAAGNPSFGAVVSADLNITTTTCTAPQVLTAISAGGVGTCTAPLLTQNSQSTAYTTVLGDAGKQIYHPGADTTARTWTIDSNANVAYSIGTCITFINDTSAGTLTIAITSDTMILAGAGTTGSRTLTASNVATACKMTSTRWIISGSSGLT